MNNDTPIPKPDSIPYKESYESPEITFFEMQLNDLIATSTPDDRGEWDINPPKPTA